MHDKYRRTRLVKTYMSYEEEDYMHDKYRRTSEDVLG